MAPTTNFDHFSNKFWLFFHCCCFQWREPATTGTKWCMPFSRIRISLQRIICPMWIPLIGLGSWFRSHTIFTGTSKRVLGVTRLWKSCVLRARLETYQVRLCPIKLPLYQTCFKTTSVHQRTKLIRETFDGTDETARTQVRHRRIVPSLIGLEC